MIIVDYIIVPASWILANIIFNKFEKHLSIYRRLIKFFLTVGILYAIGYYFGRTALYSVLALMGIGMVVLHAWWFPKNGINGLTAEPYFRYLITIDKIKGNR